jgi:hypothetical protein
MKSQWKLDIQYAETMENHPFGIALYRPPSSSEVKPGIIGYFDEFGSWNTIADLADQDDLLQKSLSPAEELVKAPTDNEIKWGPKVSSSIRATKVDLKLPAVVYVVKSLYKWI